MTVRQIPNDIVKALRIAGKFQAVGAAFTASDLHRGGASSRAVNAAIEGKYLRRTAKRKMTGRRGRPGLILALTAKGTRAAA